MLEIVVTLTLLVSVNLAILFLLLPSRYKEEPLENKNEDCARNAANGESKVVVQVLVLGDIGRSPRMQYHAESLAKHGAKVEVVGYRDSALHPGLEGNPLISIVPLSPPLLLFQKLQAKGTPFLIIGPLKVLWQVWTLCQTLGYRTEPAKWLLVQNPPSIPTLFIAMMICFLRRTRLIIDWHNYGWTILAGTRGERHPFVAISKAYEAILGRLAPTVSFTVSDAMSRQLRAPPYSIRTPILTLHDRPAPIFKPITSPSVRSLFLTNLLATRPDSAAIISGKMKLLVSSTSWTPDEDFNLLLQALESYALLRSSSMPSLPLILAIITGKGPLKSHYMNRIAALTADSKLNGVQIFNAWLPAAEYALLLASADLGVCLHKSSSGVDLPMKVVDMFGAGLPVVGFDRYESWTELVQEGVNGRGFATADQLRDVLVELLGEVGGAKLKRLREGAMKEGSRRWDEEWDSVAGRVMGFVEPTED